jgi:hypothetical protein
VFVSPPTLPHSAAAPSRHSPQQPQHGKQQAQAAARERQQQDVVRVRDARQATPATGEKLVIAASSAARPVPASAPREIPAPDPLPLQAAAGGAANTSPAAARSSILSDLFAAAVQASNATATAVVAVPVAVVGVASPRTVAIDDQHMGRASTGGVITVMHGSTPTSTAQGTFNAAALIQWARDLATVLGGSAAQAPPATGDEPAGTARSFMPAQLLGLAPVWYWSPATTESPVISARALYWVAGASLAATVLGCWYCSTLSARAERRRCALAQAEVESVTQLIVA